MAKNSFNKKTRCRKKPKYVIASFSLYRHPRFKGGSMICSNYIGWSKPTMIIRDITSLQPDQPTCLCNRKIKLSEWSPNSIILQFDRENKNVEEGVEKKVLKPNKPIEIGFDSELYDASCSNYLGCWTSWGRFYQYYLGVKWTRWKDDCKIKIIELPSYYSVDAVKRRWQFRWIRLKNTFYEMHRPDRSVK